MQTQFDWSRAEQLATLAEAVLPEGVAPDGCRVHPGVLKAVLRCLDDHGRGRACWPSRARIAAQTGFSVRTVDRALAVLVAASLVARESCCLPDSKTRSCRYTLIWSELALLRPGRRAADQTAVVTDQTAVVTDQTAVVTDQTAASGRRTAQKRQEPPAGAGGGRAGGGIWTDQERRQVVDQLRATGFDRADQLALEAEALGRSVAEVAEVVGDYHANRRLFSGPGAIAARLRTGAWPVAGVRSAAVIAARQDERRQALAAQVAVPVPVGPVSPEAAAAAAEFLAARARRQVRA